MVPGTNNVSKDGWSSVAYGWTCGHCGLERIWFSSKCCRRCGAPMPAGLPVLRQQLLKVRGGTGSEGHDQRQSSPLLQRSILRRCWKGLEKHECCRDSEELAAMQTKAVESIGSRQSRQTQCSHTRNSGSFSVCCPPAKLGRAGERAGQIGRVGGGSQKRCPSSGGGQAKSCQTPRGHRSATGRIRYGTGTPGSHLGFCRTPPQVFA